MPYSITPVVGVAHSCLTKSYTRTLIDAIIIGAEVKDKSNIVLISSDIPMLQAMYMLCVKEMKISIAFLIEQVKKHGVVRIEEDTDK